MENDILFMTLGYIFTRFAILLVIGYTVYRVLRGNSNQVPIQAQRQIAYGRPDTRFYSR
jgi:hypothetical protein